MVGLGLSLAVGALGWNALDDDAGLAPVPPSSLPQADVASAARTLDALVTAVADGDASAARTLAPDGDIAARRRLADLAANAVDLDLADFALRYLDEAGPGSAAGEWTANVEATWRLEDFDDHPARAEILVRLLAQGDRVAVSGLGVGEGRAPVWMTGRVRVRRSSETLVIDAAGDGRTTARLAQAAVRVVGRVLPRWRPELVVEVPATAAALNGALGAEPGTYTAVAAVTASVDGSTGERTPVHVFVNPGVHRRLGPVGAQVVMNHEVAHIALDAAGSTMPLWLLEGVADYVALRDVGLPVAATGAQIIGQVRRDGVPEHLPGSAEFQAKGAEARAAYEAAWLAAVELVEAGGQDALVALYRAVDGGAPVEIALDRLVGFGEAELVRRWQQRLTDLAA